MLRSNVLKGASLLAVVVTAIFFPLVMFMAYAPDGNDAAGGFHQAHLTAADAAVWIGIALTTLVMTFCARGRRAVAS